MTRQEKKEELIGLFLNGAITIGDLIDECFEFGQQHPNWIRVEDELPPNKNGFSDEVLTYDYASKCYVVAIFNYISNCWFGCGDTITHWMPLPQAPRKGGEE